MTDDYTSRPITDARWREVLTDLGAAISEISAAKNEEEGQRAVLRLLSRVPDVLGYPAYSEALVRGMVEATLRRGGGIAELTPAEFATLRRTAGLTQAQLAARLGLPISNIGGWEIGLRPIPPKHIPAILAAFGVASPAASAAASAA